MRWLAGVGEQVDGAIECPTLSLPLGEYEVAVRQIAACEARLASLRLSLTRQAELNDVQKLTGAAGTGGGVQQQTRMGRREANVSVRLAKALDLTIRATGEALSEGRISLGQAQVIERAIRRLPTNVGVDVRARAEAFLLANARTFDAEDLEGLGRHLYEVIAPEDAEKRIGKQLEEQERRARENRTLSFGPVSDGMGTMFLRADLPTLAVLRALLDPLARPRPTGPDGADPRTTERRHADAFAELLALAQAAASAPTRGGTRPRITVTLAYSDLAAKLGYGTLDSVLGNGGPTHLKVRTAETKDGQTASTYRITGDPLSATLVRQLA